jgi:hypothetical protein
MAPATAVLVRHRHKSVAAFTPVSFGGLLRGLSSFIRSFYLKLPQTCNPYCRFQGGLLFSLTFFFQFEKQLTSKLLKTFCSLGFVTTDIPQNPSHQSNPQTLDKLEHR